MKEVGPVSGALSQRGFESEGPGRGTRRAAVIGGALLCLAPVAAQLELLRSAGVGVPNLDDYDAVLDFLNRFVAAGNLRERLELVFAQHIEHRPAVLRSAVVASHLLLGRIDLPLLSALGGVALAVLLLGLLAGFRAGDRVGERLLAFAPAALLLVQPGYWSALLWPTVSLTNFSVLALALLAFLALGRDSRAGFAAAFALGLGAVFSLGNGFLVLPLGLLALAPGASWKRRVGWAAFGLALLAVYFLCYESPHPEASPWSSLARPGDLLLYWLNFIGSAGAFGRRGLAALAGILVAASFVALAARGYLRRNRPLSCLFLFVFLSAGLNAAARSAQGADAPLLQPRYQLYGSLLLALTYLAWAETLRHHRRARALFTVALAVSLAFCSLSFALHRNDALALSRRLEQGLDTWWARGTGGLAYPRFVKASAVLSTSIGNGLFPVPDRWVERFAAERRDVALPEPDRSVAFEIGTLRQEAAFLLLEGWAHVGGSARGQEVLVVLRSAERSHAFAARSVPRVDLLGVPGPAARELGRSGFRAIIPTARVEPGRYQLGILVRRGARRHLALDRREVEIAPGPGR